MFTTMSLEEGFAHVSPIILVCVGECLKLQFDCVCDVGIKLLSNKKCD